MSDKTKKPDTNSRAERLARQLGAERADVVGRRKVLTPVQLLGLAQLASERIQSTGGRPTDPSLTIKRLVGFKPQTWDRLQQITRRLNETGASIAPGQLAAFFIEQCVDDLDVNS